MLPDLISLPTEQVKEISPAVVAAKVPPAVETCGSEALPLTIWNSGTERSEVTHGIVMSSPTETVPKKEGGNKMSLD